MYDPSISWSGCGALSRLVVLGIAAWMLAACTQSTPTTSDDSKREAPQNASVVSPERFGVLERVQGAGHIQLCTDACTNVLQGAEVVVGHSLVTDPMSRAALSLQDGSSLSLDADSRLRVGADRVLIFEQGQLVVESRKATTLRTPAGDVLLDPASSVSIRATNSAREPSVYRTRVSVLTGAAQLQTNARTQSLAAGQSAIAERDDVRIQPGSNLAYQTAWARGLRVEAEVDETESAKTPEGIGNILGKDPATKRELPESIQIRKLAVRTTIRERIARTEIEQVFENTSKRTLEGLYTFPLPEDASIVRFAMEINGKMMEGELLPKKRATQIFDQVVAEYMRPKDPALLEWKGGNTFQIRIFPIFPNTPQRIILWYTQTLSADGTESRYTYPLPRTGKVAVDEFTFNADVAARSPLRLVKTPMYASSSELREEGRGASVRFEKQDFSPRNDLVLEWEEETFTTSATYSGSMKGEDDPYFMLVLRPSLDAVMSKTAARAKARDVVFVVDTSFGTTPGDLKAAHAAVAAFISELGADDRFAVLAGDQTTRAWEFGLASLTEERARKAIAFLEQHAPRGASNLEDMFGHAAKLLKGSKHPTVVYIGDGRATLGETRPRELVDTIEASFGRERAVVHAIGLGSETNASFLTRLTRRMGGVFEALNRGEDVPARVALVSQKTRRHSLRQAMLTFSSDKIDFVYPTHLPTLQQGEEIVVVGRFRGEVDAQATLTGLVGDRPFAQPFQVRLSAQEAQERSFIPRLWAQRHIHNLTLFGGPESTQNIVDTSVRYTVMSRFTSFLVLESERMYKRFRVERRGDRDYGEFGEKKAKEENTRDDQDTEEDQERERAASQTDVRISTGNSKDQVDTKQREPMKEDIRNLSKPNRAPADAFESDGMKSAEVFPSADDETSSTDSVLRGQSRTGTKSTGVPRDLLEGATGAGERAPTPTKKANDRDAKSASGPTVPLEVNTEPTAAKESQKNDRPKPNSSKRYRPRGRISAKGSGGGHQPRRPYVPARIARIQSLQPEPSTPSTQTQTLLKRVQDNPLRRDYRRALLKALARRGHTQEALDAAQDWVKLDEKHPESQWTLAVWQARAGQVDNATFSFGNAIELAPTDINLFRRLALHHTLRENLHQAYATYQALAAQTGAADDILDLISIELYLHPKRAQKRLAWLRAQSSSKLTKAQGTQVDMLLKKLGAELLTKRGQGAPVREILSAPDTAQRGAVYATLTWEGEEDLDLSITLPNGESISPNAPLSFAGKGKRGRVLGEARNGHRQGSKAKVPREAILLRHATRGRYLVEVVRNDSSTRPLRATVKIRALQQTRTFQIEIPAQERDVRVAQISVTSNPLYGTGY